MSSPIEWVAILALLAIAGILLFRKAPPGMAGVAVAAGVVAAAAASVSVQRPAPSPPAETLPAPIEGGEYTTSDDCRACHPGAYASWHESFHRTMTQVARADTILADFDGVVLEDRGHRVELSREGDAFYAELADPLWLADPSPTRPATAPRIRARVVMTTGSHHLQNYWIRRPASGEVYQNSYDNGALVQIPFVWLIDEGRWIPTQDSFLTPPTPRPDDPLVWNSSCHLCHSVAPEPRLANGAFETRAVELGIACEACHGPAADHIAANRSPLARYAKHFSEGGDDSILQPERLTRDRSAEACAQCHSFGAILDIPGWQAHGVGYRPGTPLGEKKAVLRFEDPPQSPELLAHLVREPNALVGRFWEDGTIRVAGREFNGLAESACFERGTLTCVTCHSMHDYREPNDQLVQQDMDAVCSDCHAHFARDPIAHTNHAADSAGSRCINCHMPHTTYGLFVAMRSHRIDSPSVRVSMETGRPNACNLCHLGESLAWTAGHLQAWYGIETPGDPPTDAAGPVWALAGDAAQRAVTAWHLGWDPARLRVPESLPPALLARLLDDPYAAVRRVAGNALRAQPGFEEFEYDFLAPPSQRQERRQRAIARTPATSPEQRERFRTLARERNDRPLRIIE